MTGSRSPVLGLASRLETSVVYGDFAQLLARSPNCNQVTVVNKIFPFIYVHSTEGFIDCVP